MRFSLRVLGGLALPRLVTSKPAERPTSCVQGGGGALRAVSRYGDEHGGPERDIALLFHGAGHYELLLSLKRLPRPRL
jgi:hypothetical protein